MKKGFTLTELLVVVLIIGVLSAIALPQYTKAVDKSRFSTLMPVANHVRDAQEAFYMASAEYTTDLQSAGVNIGTVTGNKAVIDDMSAEVTADGTDGYVTVSKDGLDNRYVLYFNRSANYPQEIHCEALSSSDRAKSLCVTMGGTELGANGSYTKYVLSGTGNGTTNSGGTSTPEETPTPDPVEPEPDTPAFDYPGANLTPGTPEALVPGYMDVLTDKNEWTSPYVNNDMGNVADVIYTGAYTATILFDNGKYAEVEFADRGPFLVGDTYVDTFGASVTTYDDAGTPLEQYAYTHHSMTAGMSAMLISGAKVWHDGQWVSSWVD